jgi:hypothetical protein
MQVVVTPGAVAVPTPNNTGTTLCTSDAPENVTLIAAPAAGNNRIDLIVCLARGNDLDGGVNNDFVFSAVAGVVAATPAVPAIPAGAVAVAQVYVTGGASAIVAGNITDRRPISGLAIPTNRPWNVPWGLVAPPLVSTVNGTTSPGAETKDAVLGDLAFTAVANRRYRVVQQNEVANGGAGDDWYLNVRDGGAASPTVASPLVAQHQIVFYASGSAGRFMSDFSKEVGALTAGPHTFARFNSRSLGTSTYVPVTLNAPWREMYVEDIGPIAGSTPPPN